MPPARARPPLDVPTTNERTGCLKRTGLGCLGILGLGILVVVVGTIIDVIRFQSAAPAAATLEAAPEAVEGGPLLVVLDLQDGDFRVEPATTGGLRVEGRFDPAIHELSQVLETDPAGNRTWTVRFRDRSILPRLVVHADEGDDVIRVLIPPSLPVELVAHFEKGAGRLDLGGMSVTTAHVSAKMGEWVVAFGEPTLQPLEQLSVHSKMGDMRIEELGNASPRTVHVGHDFGSLRVDLAGAWRTQSDVNVRFRFGEVSIIAPPEVPLALGEIAVKAGDQRIPELMPSPSAEAGSPVVRLSGGGSFGELSIDR